MSLIDRLLFVPNLFRFPLAALRSKGLVLAFKPESHLSILVPTGIVGGELCISTKEVSENEYEINLTIWPESDAERVLAKTGTGKNGMALGYKVKMWVALCVRSLYNLKGTLL